MTKENTNNHAKIVDAPQEFFEAAKNSDTKLIRKFIGKGVDINAKDSNGETALHLASENGHVNVVTLLLAQPNADVDAQGVEGWNALHFASANGHTNVVKLLLEHHADVDVQNQDRMNALHLATGNDHQKVVKLLLKNRTNINAEGWHGWRAIHLATNNNSKGLMKFLLEQPDIDVNAKNDDDETALNIARREGHSDLAANIAVINLFSAIYKNDIEEANALIKEGVDVNTKLKGKVALHIAAENGYKETMEFLFKYNADVNARDWQGRRAIHLATNNNCKGLMKFLLEQPGIVINVKKTVDIAIENGHRELAKIIEGAKIMKGIDISDLIKYVQSIDGNLDSKDENQKPTFKYLVKYLTGIKGRGYFDKNNLSEIKEELAKIISNNLAKSDVIIPFQSFLQKYFHWFNPVPPEIASLTSVDELEEGSRCEILRDWTKKEFERKPYLKKLHHTITGGLPFSIHKDDDGKLIATGRPNELLGKGRWGKVYKAFDLNTGQLIANKKEIVKSSDKIGFFVNKERNALERANQLVGKSQDNGKNKFYTFQHRGGITLFKWLKVSSRSEIEKIEMVTKILDCLIKTHRNKVIHRDLHAGNVLVNDDGSVQLCDFGYSEFIDQSAKIWKCSGEYPSNNCYCPPELWKGKDDIDDLELSTSIDVYSFGCLLNGPYYKGFAGFDLSSLTDLKAKCCKEKPEDRIELPELRIKLETKLKEAQKRADAGNTSVPDLVSSLYGKDNRDKTAPHNTGKKGPPSDWTDITRKNWRPL